MTSTLRSSVVSPRSTMEHRKGWKHDSQRQTTEHEQVAGSTS
jgi:hypothetical protein